MSWKKFIAFFIAEVLVTLVVILLFRTISEKRIAGLFAATLFLTLGVALLWNLVRGGQPWKTLSFWVVLVHLGFTSIPLFVVRLFSWNTGFHEIQIWHIPGPVFHYTAERVFAALMIATLIDAGVVGIKGRRKKSSN